MRIIFFALMCVLSTLSNAANYTVSNNADSGAGSLRQAITDANASGATPHTITYSVAYSYNAITFLSSNLPLISAARVNFRGNARLPWINGNNLHSILRADAGVTLDVQDMVFDQGLRSHGGCIALNSNGATGSLIVRNSQFYRCKANDASSAGGGAIHWNNNGNGFLLVEDSYFYANTATSTNIATEQPRGGAIQSTAVSDIQNNVFESNLVVATGTRGGFGGAIYLIAPGGLFQSLLQGNRFINNTVTPSSSSFGRGGAVQIFIPSDGRVNVNRNYFAGNVGNEGGAIGAMPFGTNQGILSLQNNTFTSNGVSTVGGALHADNLQLIADHNSFYLNDANVSGAHLYFSNIKVNRLVHNVLAATSSGSACNISGLDQTGAYRVGNLFAEVCAALSSGSGIVSTNLSVLQVDASQRVGVVQFAPGSAVIDGGTLTASDCLPQDAQLNTRPRDGDGNGSAICDVGAYEHLNTLIFSNGFE